MKKILAVTLAVSGMLAASGAAQLTDGTMQLRSGKYTITVLPGRAFTISGFAYDGKELFVSPTSTSGTQLSPSPAEPERLIKITLLQDGEEKPVDQRVFDGQNLVLDRETQLGALKLFTRLTLTPQGLNVAIRYKAETAVKLNYFFLYTMSWGPQFSQCLSVASGKETEDMLKSTGNWTIGSDIEWLALYMPQERLGVITGIETTIPTSTRRHAIWDHKAYRKYFIFHKNTNLTAGYESPEYRICFKGFNATEDNWQEIARATAGTMPVQRVETPERKLNSLVIQKPGPVTGRDDWKQNRRGIEALDPDFVLPPFENVQADEQGARVWHRRYDIAASGLLEKAAIGGKPAFTRPMTMNMTIDGKSVEFHPSGGKLISSHKGRAVYERSMDSADATLTTRTTIEYDGMVRVDLTLTPKKKLSLDKFDYAFHLPRSNALYAHFIGCPPGNNLSIMIPRESLTIPVPDENGIFMQEPFKTLVWLGDNDQGFLWFCGSERNWSPQNPDNRPGALSAEKTPREVTFKVAPVTEKMTVETPITYTFGFFATPVRPMPEKWRTWFFTTRRAMYGSEAAHGYVGNMPMIWPDEFRSTAAPYLSAEGEAKIKKFAGELHRAGRNVLGYCDPIRVHIGYLRYLDNAPRSQQLNDLFLASPNEDDAFLYRVPVLAENMKDWQTLPELIYAYGAARGGREVRVSSASGWADFFCFLMECYAKLGFDGMGDIDNCFPIRDMNERHGAGYVGQDGKRHWEWDWFERRDLMKRIAAIFLKERGKPGILVAHASATWSIPFISFCDAKMTYEHSNSGYFASPALLSKYVKHNDEITADLKKGGTGFLRQAFPPERWRGELSGRQFGLPTVIMSNLTKSPQVDKEYAKSERAARELTAFIVAHDTLMWPIWCNPAPMVKLQKIREGFGLAEKDVVFHPYWEKTPVNSTETRFSIGVYQRPGKALVCVSNLTTGAASGELDFSELNPKSVKDAENDTGMPLENGKLKLCLQERDYKIFEVLFSK